MGEPRTAEEIIDSVRGYPDDRIAGPLWVKDPLGAYVLVADLPAILEAARALTPDRDETAPEAGGES